MNRHFIKITSDNPETASQAHRVMEEAYNRASFTIPKGFKISEPIRKDEEGLVYSWEVSWTISPI